MNYTLHHGDALDVLPTLAGDSLDAMVTDPPAGIAFMGKQWDTPGAFVERKPDKSVRFDMVGGNHHPIDDEDRARTRRTERARFVARMTPIFAESLRVLKPGARALVWGIPRTSHWTACALEDAGFIVENRLAHFFGSGFPKGKGQLKPAVEDWWLVRKPGGKVPALNIDACRVEGGARPMREVAPLRPDVAYSPSSLSGRVDGSLASSRAIGETTAGRWPPNLLLSHSDECRDQGLAADWSCVDGCPVKMLDEQSGMLTSGANPTRRGSPKFRNTYDAFEGQETCEAARGVDTGTASRFFPQFTPDPFLYAPKASRRERNEGCEGLPARAVTDADKWAANDRRSGTDRQPSEWKATPAANNHPTVKPQALMRWLCRLIAKPGDLVLDPFTGSGSTGVAALAEGMHFVGIEREAEYVEIARARIEEAARPPVQPGFDFGTP